MVAGTMYKPLTDKEKDGLLKQVLGWDCHRAGKNLPVLETATDMIGNADDSLSFAESS